ncbi:MAG: hypothetical protein PF904_08650 [Kiritimatiellae bacterium]|nr:hypothetical protein [Kiritimatiellia bacterium]
MLSNLFKGVVSDVAVRMLVNYRHLSIRVLKIEAAKSYLHGIRLARLSALGLMRIVFMIGLVGGGVLLLHAGVFILLPWTVKAKAILGLVLGTAYVVAGVLLLRVAMDEKTWLQKSGCMKMLEEVTGPPRES